MVSQLIPICDNALRLELARAFEVAKTLIIHKVVGQSPPFQGLEAVAAKSWSSLAGGLIAFVPLGDGNSVG